jgi:sulfite exporter TauE/SafE
MMSTVGLLAAAAVAGLAGSPHCVAMCGAACAGIGATPRRAAAFQAGRLAGYALLGGVVAASAGALQWAAGQATLLKPFWAMFHVAVVLLGASLVWAGAQPAWLERGAQQMWRALRMHTLDLDMARWPAAAGALWALLPCGLLYSALMLAALADSAGEGAAVMATFALASGAGLQFGATLLRKARAGAGRWGVRAAGAALVAASLWALLHGLRHEIAALCA